MGVSGSSPGPSSPAACHLLEADAADPGGQGGGAARTWRLVLDLGSGAFGPLQALAAPDQLDAVVLTHLHADHCLDVTALHVAAAYGPRRPAHPGGRRPRGRQRQAAGGASACGCPSGRRG